VGDSRRTLNLPSAQSYSSFILLPLLTFATPLVATLFQRFRDEDNATAPSKPA